MSHFLSSLSPEALLAHHRWVRALAKTLVLDDSEADDLVQQAWLTAIEKPPRKKGSLRAWLGSVVRNRAKELARGESRRDKREHAAAKPEGQADTAELVARAEAQRIVVQAVLELEEPARSTMLLRFFENLPPREVARRLGEPVETVRSRIRRALAAMRESLDETFGDRGTWNAALLPLAGLDLPFPGATAGDGGSTSTSLPQTATVAKAAALLIAAVAGATAVVVLRPTSDEALRAHAQRLHADVEDARTRLSLLGDEVADERARLADLDAAVASEQAALDEVLRAATAEPASADDAPPEPRPPIRFAVADHRDVLARQDWRQVGNDLSELIRVVARLADELAATGSVTAQTAGDVQMRNGPVAALALRLHQSGIPGTHANSAFSHPYVTAHLIAAVLEARGLPLSATQAAALGPIANERGDEERRLVEKLGEDPLSMSRIAVEARVRVRMRASVESILTSAQMDALCPEHFRERAGIDLFFEGQLWPYAQLRGPQVADRDTLRAKLLRDLSEALPGTEPEEDVRLARILDGWFATVPAAEFAAPGDRLDRAGFHATGRLVEWTDRTAALLEIVSSSFELSDAARNDLRGQLTPLVPLAPSDKHEDN